MEIVVAVLLVIAGVLILALSISGWFGETVARPSANPPGIYPGKRPFSRKTRLRLLGAHIENASRQAGKRG